MQIRKPSRSKVVLILLAIAVVTSIISLFLFQNIDSIVHGDLYNHGLIFSDEWAQRYWDMSLLFQISQVIVAIITAVSLISLSRAKTLSQNLISATIGLLVVAAGLIIFSAYLFNSIDYLINNDLYQYGLQFDPAWAVKYWGFARSLFGTIGLAVGAILVSIFLVYVGTRRKLKINTVRLAFLVLVAVGVLSLTISVALNSLVLTYVGLGLLFWGIIFSYVREEEYVKKSLLDATANSQANTLHHVLNKLGYTGTPIYLPPKFFKDPETTKLYIPKDKKSPIPTPEQIKNQELKGFKKKFPGLLLKPPSADLAQLFETTLETTFTKVDLQYLEETLPQLFIEKMEIAQDFKMKTENSTIHVSFEKPVFANPATLATPNTESQTGLGSALGSAIAIALAKTLGKPIIVSKEEISQDKRDLTIVYQVLEEGALIES